MDAFIHLEQVEDAQKLAQNTVQQVGKIRKQTVNNLIDLFVAAYLLRVQILGMRNANYCHDVFGNSACTRCSRSRRYFVARTGR